MRKTWLLPGMFPVPVMAPASAYVLARTHTATRRERLKYVDQQRKTYVLAHGDKGLERTIAARTSLLYDASGARHLLTRIFTSTQRLTLYTPTMDADALIARAAADPELAAHVRRVMSFYRDGYNSRAFETNFIDSEAGQKLCDYVGYVTHDGRLYDIDDLPRCMYCEDRLFLDQEVYIRDSDGDQVGSAHRDCAHSEAYRCDVSGEYFEDYDDFVELHDTGDDAAREYCLERGLIFREYDEDEDEDVYVRRRGGGGLLVGYHHAPRPWEHATIPNGALGVELEVGFKNGDQGRAKFLKKYVEGDGRFKDDWPFSCERDGSLGGVPGGMEIIGDPLMLRAGYQKRGAPWRKLLKALYEAGGQGWQWRSLAGLHVNLCVVDEPDDAVFKYAAFIGNAEAMSKFIAGRKHIYGTERGYVKVPRRTMLSDESIPQGLSHIFRNGKYAAVSRRNSACLETRIFGSNIRYEGFMACVEYCVAAMEFVRPLHRLDVLSPTVAAEFRQWLGTKTTAYPNLAARLGIVAHDAGTAFPSDQRVAPVLAAA